MTTPPFSVKVDSEIAPLRQVLVHRPGDEVVRMTQRELSQLLFDDILAPDETMREHDLMAEILAAAGARVMHMGDLLERALTRAPAEARRALLEKVCELSGVFELAEILADFSPERLATALIAGLDWKGLGAGPETLWRLRQRVDDSPRALPPVPNLMFMRDPCFTVRDRIVVSRMAMEARRREPELVSFALQHSGLVEGAKLLFEPKDSERAPAYRRLEGGDVLVLSPKVLCVGCSQRTSAQTIERLAREALFPAFPELERVYAVMMPDARTIMHLDTFLTQVDEQLFLGYQPLVTGEAALPVACLERDRPPRLATGASILDVLRDELGRDTSLVPCGGNDPLHQEREQWTDGANALCLAPGRVILYARNVHTIAALREHGFHEAAIHQVLPAEQRAELIAEAMARPRAVISFPGSELSRARGGGRCLTMPLVRG